MGDLVHWCPCGPTRYVLASRTYGRMAVAGARILIEIHLGATSSAANKGELESAAQVAVVAQLAVRQAELGPLLEGLMILRQGYGLEIGVAEALLYSA